jgi:predicted nucleotidyltransferase
MSRPLTTSRALLQVAALLDWGLGLREDVDMPAAHVLRNGMDMAHALTTDEVTSTLRAHEAELRRAGIVSLGLFGSVARDDARPDSDIDLVAELDPEAKVSLFDIIGLKRKLGELFDREVQILPEPIQKDRLRAHIEQDRVHVCH